MALPNRAWVFTMQAFLQEKAYEQSSIHLKNQSKRALASPMLLARQETATVSQLESAREQQFRREASAWNMELLLDELGCSVVLNIYVCHWSGIYLCLHEGNILTELKCHYLKTESHFIARLDMETCPLNTMHHPLLINSLHHHTDPDEMPQVPLVILGYEKLLTAQKCGNGEENAWTKNCMLTGTFILKSSR